MSKPQTSHPPDSSASAKFNPLSGNGPEDNCKLLAPFPIRPFPVNGLHEARAGVIKALGHPTRLWIVEELASGPRCVCEFVEAVGSDFSTVSKHLLVLKNAGIVDIDKRGKQIFYSLRVPCILNFLGCVTEVLRADAESRSRVLKAL